MERKPFLSEKEIKDNIRIAQIKCRNFSWKRKHGKMVWVRGKGCVCESCVSNQIVIDGFIHLARHHANKFPRVGCLTTDDYIQEATMGLDRAIRKYDPNFGVKFITYATFWIKQFILRAIQFNADMIHIPLDKLKPGKVRLSKVEEPEEPRPKKFTYKNLDAEHYVPDNSSEDFEDRSNNIELVNIGLKYLSERERFIIRKCYIEKYTLAEIGRELGMSRERVRQIRDRSIHKMRLVLEIEPKKRRNLIPEEYFEPRSA